MRAGTRVLDDETDAIGAIVHVVISEVGIKRANVKGHVKKRLFAWPPAPARVIRNELTPTNTGAGPAPLLMVHPAPLPLKPKAFWTTRAPTLLCETPMPLVDQNW